MLLFYFIIIFIFVISTIIFITLMLPVSICQTVLGFMTKLK